jgi:hypothetical protein
VITIDAIGLDKANSQVEYIRAAIAAYGGCYYRGSSRSDAAETNAAVMQHLKDNEPRRDLKTLSDENADVIATAWQNEVMAKADRMMDSAAAGGAASKMNAQQVARAQSAAGFRAASKVILRLLRQRIESRLTADDSGGLSPAAPVGEDYAKQRARKYGVTEDAIYVATGQLLADMDPANSGQVVLVPGSGVK